MKRRMIIFTLLLCMVLLNCSFLSYSKPVYPLTANVTLKYWMELHTNVSQIAKNFGDTEFAKELAKRTGVKCEFLHPAAGQTTEAFNLMLASGELPDLIEYKWYDIPGGPNQALKDGYILKLNKVFDKYAPNLKKYLKANPEIDRMVKTDEGDYYVFPFVRGGPKSKLLVTSGLIVRKDWLDELGLAVPETIDEWYTVLKAFKEKKGAAAPLTIPKLTASTGYLGTYMRLWSNFSGAYNTYRDFYVENGKVKHGALDPGQREFLATMRKWYTEGLLDPNFATADNKMVDANILSGKSGAAYGSGGSGIGRWLQAMAGKEPKSYNLVAAPCPGPKKGVLPKFSFVAPAYGRDNNGSVAISARCKNIEAAARLLDYAYSPEGYNFYNFGMEGVSYKMVNSYPTYTELIMRNPEKLAITQAMSKYMRGHTNGPFVQDEKYLEQYYELPQQKEAMVQWSKTEMFKYMLPPVTSTQEETSELARIMNDLTTYADEMMLKFIMGVEPLENFDKYTAQLKKMGIDRGTEIMQAALDRYNKRKKR